MESWQEVSHIFGKKHPNHSVYAPIHKGVFQYILEGMFSHKGFKPLDLPENLSNNLIDITWITVGHSEGGKCTGRITQDELFYTGF